jgi:hypothetical protein
LQTNIGISNFPVSEDIDPGFGPDTEQRRVDFASKLEEEDYNISLDDALKIAKANLITALKLWNKQNLILKVEKLSLQDIMIIWLVFDFSYIVKVIIFYNENDKDIILNSYNNFLKYSSCVFVSLLKDIPAKVLNIIINKDEIGKIRNLYGGDLIFSLRNKNFEDIYKTYEVSQSKLSLSLRIKYLFNINGIRISFIKFKYVFRHTFENILENIVKIITIKLNRLKLYSDKSENLFIISEIISSFDAEASKLFINNIKDTTTEIKKTNEKVKKYYGIK